MPLHHLFIGTYTRAGSRGIYALQLDSATGELSPPTVAAEAVGPTYLALSPDRKLLYAVEGSDRMATGFAIDAARSTLTPLERPTLMDRQAPSHIAVDHTGRVVLVANYHSAFVASLPVGAGGIPSPAASVIPFAGSSVNPTRQSSPHPHSINVSPDNRYAFVCDLGLDKIFCYRLDPAAATLTPAEPAFVAATPGAGPRHLTFSPDGRYAFMIAEMGGTMSAFAYHPANGALELRSSISILPPGFRGENTSAAVRVHPNGRFVYGSNRGPDTLTVLAFDASTGQLTPIESVASGGRAPRDFALSLDGQWLVAAHQDSNSLTVFRVDPSSGRLTRTAASATLSMPVCVVFVD